MLEQIDLTKTMEKEAYREEIAQMELTLARMQRACKEQKIPVIIIFEGFDASGKGLQINKLIHPLDPRGFHVYAMKKETKTEQMYPFLWRFWAKTPEKGRIAIFDTSGYRHVSVDFFEKKLSKEERNLAYQEINTFERTLTDDGAVLIKLFLHISKKDQKKRFEKLLESKETAWRVSREDLERNKNYDGYKFSLEAKNQIYNSNMCLYFLNRYIEFGKIPTKLIDVNIASDYSKIGKMLGLCKGENRLEILRKTVQGEPINNNIVEKFNPAIEFNEKDMISMLYYLGYLTIFGEDLGMPELTIPNKVMKEIYADYFMQLMNQEADFRIDNTRNQEILREIAREGKIDKMVETLRIYLNNLSNRDLIKFDEKYIKLIFYCIAMTMPIYSTKSEMEVNRNYPDILLVPRDRTKGYKAIMVEFKYLKKGDIAKLEDKQKEAREQIGRYSEFEDIKDIEGLRKYTIVVAGNELYVEEI